MKRLLLLLLCFFYSDVAYAQLAYTTYLETAGPTPQMSTTAYQASTSGTIPTMYISNVGSLLGAPRTNLILVHITGTFTMPTSSPTKGTFASGTVINVNLYDQSDDGFVLKLNGTTIINNWKEQGVAGWGTNQGVNGSANVNLIAGQTYTVDAWYYNNGGGYGMQLLWNFDSSGSSYADVPASVFSTQVTATGSSTSNVISTSVSGNTTNTYSTAVTTTTYSNGTQTQTNGASTLLGSVTTAPGISITATEQNLMNQSINIGHNLVYIQQSNGNNTTVNVTQTGDHNTFQANIAGDKQTLTTTQTGNYDYENSVISGSNNIMNNTQIGNNKTLFQNVSGSNNNITTTQSGTGNHYLELNIPTDSNTINVTQSGTAQKMFSLTLNSANTGVTVVQDNATTADSASMSITCYSGPCTGYSYIKH